MKIETEIKFISPETSFEVYPDGAESAALFCRGRKVISIGRVKIGKFDETAALPEKLRRHLDGDRLAARAEAVTVIPFGCEYHVGRHWKFSGDTVELVADLRADNGGSFSGTAMDLEEIRFPGEVETLEILPAGEKSWRTFSGDGIAFEGGCLPLAVRVRFADGCRAEFYSGDDFWRHISASAPGGTPAYTVRKDAAGVVCTRGVLRPGEDESAGADRRQWRFRSLFGASPGGTAGVPPAGASEVSFSGCFASPALQRGFRSFVRRSPSGADAVMNISGPLCCEEGSHVFRPGKKALHGMLGELFNSYIWAAGELAGKGGRFMIFVHVPELSDSVIAGNLSRPAPRLSAAGSEEI